MIGSPPDLNVIYCQSSKLPVLVSPIYVALILGHQYVNNSFRWTYMVIISNTKQHNTKSSEEWSLQLWLQFMQLRKKPEKKWRTSTGFEPVTSSQHQWLHSSVGRAFHGYCEVMGSNPVEVPNFFKASHAIAEIAFTTARIILDLISFPQFLYMICSIYFCHDTMTKCPPLR